MGFSNIDENSRMKLFGILNVLGALWTLLIGLFPKPRGDEDRLVLALDDAERPAAI